MSVSNNNVNGWGTWSNDFNLGTNFANNVNQQVSSIQNQLNALIQEYNNHSIDANQFESQTAPLVSQMNAFISGLGSQYTALEQNSVFMNAVNNLNTAWQTTQQTFPINNMVANPNYPNNSNQPFIPMQLNSNNGTATVTFTAPYNHCNGDGCYLNGVQNLNWLPSTDSTVWDNYPSDLFANFLEDADQNQHQTQTCTYNGETITVVANGDGTMTVTVTGSPSVFNPTSSGTPSTSSLSTFLKSI